MEKLVLKLPESVELKKYDPYKPIPNYIGIRTLCSGNKYIVAQTEFGFHPISANFPLIIPTVHHEYTVPSGESITFTAKTLDEFLQVYLTCPHLYDVFEFDSKEEFYSWVAQ